MTTNSMLEHAKQVKSIATDLTTITQNILHTKDMSGCHYGTPIYQHVSSLNEKLISLHVYLDDVLNRLEWRHYVRARLKKELSNAGWVLVGIIIGISFCLPHMVRHN